MKAIVAVDKNWAIGNKGKLLVSIPSDMKRFREITSGKVVVLGRKTMATFPNGQPLKNRTNIVLTKDANYKAGDAIIVHSIDELLDELKNYPTDDVYIIGGDSVYKQMLPYVDTCEVTKIRWGYEADSFFPNLEKDDEWEITYESEEQTYFDTEYTFQTWSRK
ncbi:MAG: dihydrofolate reductase [Lachnospiraceae bacterium]|nr:dihydrofolate reductase [Lachnospiraceae bacterium]